MNFRQTMVLGSGTSGVTAENFLFNIEADRLYCILNAPNKGSIESHHKKYGVICEWIMEIKTSA
jgi:hypothetical protein